MKEDSFFGAAKMNSAKKKKKKKKKKKFNIYFLNLFKNKESTRNL